MLSRVHKVHLACCHFKSSAHHHVQRRGVRGSLAPAPRAARLMATLYGHVQILYGTQLWQSWMCNFLPPGGVLIPKFDPGDDDQRPSRARESGAWLQEFIDGPHFRVLEFIDYISLPERWPWPSYEDDILDFLEEWDDDDSLVPLSMYLLDLLWSFDILTV